MLDWNNIILIGSLCLVCVGAFIWSYQDTRQRNLMQYARAQVSHAEASLESWDTHLDTNYALFRCAGCDCVFMRGSHGYLRIGPSFEFCSQACKDQPIPFPSVTLN